MHPSGSVTWATQLSDWLWQQEQLNQHWDSGTEVDVLAINRAVSLSSWGLRMIECTHTAYVDQSGHNHSSFLLVQRTLLRNLFNLAPSHHEEQTKGAYWASCLHWTPQSLKLRGGLRPVSGVHCSNGLTCFALHLPLSFCWEALFMDNANEQETCLWLQSNVKCMKQSTILFAYWVNLISSLLAIISGR